MATHRTPGPVRPVRRALPLTLVLLGTLATYLTFAAFREVGLVVGTPWLLTALFVAGVLAAVDVGRRPVSRTEHVGRTGAVRPHLRLALLLAACTALAWLGGWSALLPAMAGLVSVVHVETAGSRVWRPTVLAIAVLTVLGQVLVALDLVASVIPDLGAHLAAAWLLLISTVTIAYVGRSVAEREGLEAAQRRAEGRVNALLNSSSDVVAVVDREWCLTYASPAAATLGRAPEELVGTPLLDLVDREHRAAVRENLERVLRAGVGARDSMDVLVVVEGRERRWYEWTVQNLLDDPLVEGLVLTQRDISERLVQQGALAHAASHDPLTGLANRAELMQMLRSALGGATPSAGVALLFLDLDGFKQVNDTHGHTAGDELLVAVARRIERSLRPPDHAARMGGDEFCVLLTEVRDSREVDVVVERLERAVAEPVAVGGERIEVGVSVGVALTTDTERDPTDLLAEADTAMYRAKRERLGRTGPGAATGGPPPRPQGGPDLRGQETSPP
jgi:diguanylate cyclase (GGDEF)-like protein/PAS domain S-box-containing protein